MPRKLPPFDMDDLIGRYQAGESMKSLTSMFDLSPSYIRKQMSKRGIARTRAEADALRSANATGPVWTTEAIRLYESGMSQAEIGAVVGKHQATVSTVLRKYAETRDASEAGRLQWAKLSPIERRLQTQAAHHAVRGKTRTLDDLERRALGKQLAQSHATEQERHLASALNNLGIDTVLQQAVSKYNLDIGASPVAVELFGGGWHAYGRHAARMPQRIEDIANAGWNMLIVWDLNWKSFDQAAVAHDIAAYVEQSRRDPTFRRQYRVIWGDGEFYSAGSVDDDHLALVPPTVASTYPAGN